MIQTTRKTYNDAFTAEKYESFLDHIASLYNYRPSFRIAETPVFFDDIFKEKLIRACNDISDVICAPDFKENTEGAFVPQNRVPNEDAHATFLCVDFGVCEENGVLTPKLIELQGFPSLYFFQKDLTEAYQACFDVQKNLTPYFSGLNTEGYIELLRQTILGDSEPENVVLLEVEPEKQNTQIDFWSTANYLKIKVLCLTKVIKIGRELFYDNEQGEKIRIEKIYNRVIFDELDRRPDLTFGFSFTDDLEVEWIGHPNWFFRISKYTLPLLTSDFVPKTYFLDKTPAVSTLNLSDFVLKPLFSFSGQGVKINVTTADIEAVNDPQNWILQEKVQYAPVLETPSGATKVEIRMLLLWQKEWSRPRIINNLIRLSKGEMIGVRYNKDKDWVGASVGLFNP
ncbi:MAG: hypothetical protein HC817_13000 [Saprospiraceae bacterium]|nr:hypothetical protein [Saprospiraceae bacterium]